MNIEIPFIVPCFKRVFVAECHNRYSEFLWQGSLHTRYAVGFGRVRRTGERRSEGGRKGEKKGERKGASERERMWLSCHLEKTLAGSPNNLEWVGKFRCREVKVYGTPCVSTSTFCVVCLA
jgi:hypothetical protein